MARLMKHSGVEWIGDIPADWKVGRVSYFFDIQLGKMLQPEANNANDTLENYLCAVNLGGNKLKLDTLRQMWFSPSDKKKFDVRKGDLLVVEGGDVASCDIVNEDIQDVYIQNALHRVRSSAGFDVRLLRYLLIVAKAQGYIDLICNKATISHFTKEKFSAIPYPIPPLDEQQRIASFLDDKCARIDSVIEKTRTSIEEYKKLKQALITRAVTKGIRPNRTLKHSGIEWIGDIPSDWKIIKLKYLFSIIGGNGFPEILQGNATGDYPFCKVSDINGASDYVDTASNWVSQSVVDDNRFNIIPTGSIIMAKIGAALAKNHRKINAIRCCIDNNTQALVPRRNDDTRYLLYLSKCIDMSWFDNNSTVPSINNPKLMNFFVVIPPLDEQKEIAQYLDEKTAAIDSLVAKKNRLAEELESLKKSLIFEYVTGKKEALK